MTAPGSENRRPCNLLRTEDGPTWPPRACDDTCPRMTTLQAAGGTRPHTPLQVAGRLDTLVAADQFPADELDRLGAARRRVCGATVRRLQQLLDTVRAGARARAELDGLRSELLRDGALPWTPRRNRRSAAPTLSTSSSAGGRHLSGIDGDGTGTGTVTVVPA